MSRRSHSVLGTVVTGLAALALCVPAASSQPIGGQHEPVPAPINARGTDVAAPDQQAPKDGGVPDLVVVARGTDVAAPDQQAPKDGGIDASAPVADAPGEAPSRRTLLFLVALGFTGLGAASWVTLSRHRTRISA